MSDDASTIRRSMMLLPGYEAKINYLIGRLVSSEIKADGLEKDLKTARDEKETVEKENDRLIGEIVNIMTDSLRKDFALLKIFGKIIGPSESVCDGATGSSALKQ